MSLRATALRRHSFKPLWISSTVFSLVVIASSRVLEESWFSGLLAPLAIAHVLVVILSHPRLSRGLLFSQGLVAVATLAAIVLHLVGSIGPPRGLAPTLFSFVLGSLKSVWTYVHFAGYVALFSAAVGALIFLVKLFRRTWAVSWDAVLAGALAGSAVNLAVDYSLRRPLYQVSGDPEAVSFFFAAGLFGLEMSLPVFVLLLAACWWWYWHGGRIISSAKVLASQAL